MEKVQDEVVQEPKRINLEQEEVTSLKTMIQAAAEIEAVIAKLSIHKLSIQGEISGYFEKWKHQNEQLEGVRKKLGEKYGDGSINLDEGYFEYK
jgi:hypothetical protein